MVSSESEVTDATEGKDSETETKTDSNSEQRSDDLEGDTEAANGDQDDLVTGEGIEEEGDKVKFVTTACGDYHNLAIDTSGEQVTSAP